jgi:hypothetical protein
MNSNYKNFMKKVLVIPCYVIMPVLIQNTNAGSVREIGENNSDTFYPDSASLPENEFTPLYRVPEESSAFETIEIGQTVKKQNSSRVKRNKLSMVPFHQRDLKTIKDETATTGENARKKINDYQHAGVLSSPSLYLHELDQVIPHVILVNTQVK